MSVIVKTSYNNDVRRLTLANPINGSSSDGHGAGGNRTLLDVLRQSIVDAYSLPPLSFAVKYVDDEGEMITISSVTELNEALSVSGSSSSSSSAAGAKLPKLFVERTDVASTSNGSRNGNTSGGTMGMGSMGGMGMGSGMGYSSTSSPSSFMTSVGSVAGSFSFSSPPPTAPVLPPLTLTDLYTIMMDIFSDHTIIACLPTCLRSAYDTLMEWQKTRGIHHQHGSIIYHARELLERILATAPSVVMTTPSMARLLALLPQLMPRLELWQWRLDPSLVSLTRMLAHDQLPHLADTLRHLLASGILNSLPLSPSSSSIGVINSASGSGSVGPASVTTVSAIPPSYSSLQSLPSSSLGYSIPTSSMVPSSIGGAKTAASSNGNSNSNGGSGTGTGGVGTTFELSRLMAIFPPSSNGGSSGGGGGGGGGNAANTVVSSQSGGISSGNYPSLFASSSPGSTSTPSSSSLSLASSSATVKHSSSSSNDTGNGGNAVFCGACGMSPIIGLRYVCSVCPSYDLCQRCESAGHHRHHSLYELMPKPSATHAASANGGNAFGNPSSSLSNKPSTANLLGMASSAGSTPVRSTSTPSQGGASSVLNSLNASAGVYPAASPRSLSNTNNSTNNSNSNNNGSSMTTSRERSPSASRSRSNSNASNNGGSGNGNGTGGWRQHSTTPHKYKAKFVRDVTIADRSHVSPAQTMMKTWEVSNVGHTQWPEGVKLVFLRGDRAISAEEEYPVPRALVGQTVSVSVVIATPALSGRYTAFFRLADGRRHMFGPRLWVDVLVDSNITELQEDHEHFGSGIVVRTDTHNNNNNSNSNNGSNSMANNSIPISSATPIAMALPSPSAPPLVSSSPLYNPSSSSLPSYPSLPLPSASVYPSFSFTSPLPSPPSVSAISSISSSPSSSSLSLAHGSSLSSTSAAFVSTLSSSSGSSYPSLIGSGYGPSHVAYGHSITRSSPQSSMTIAPPTATATAIARPLPSPIGVTPRSSPPSSVPSFTPFASSSPSPHMVAATPMTQAERFAPQLKALAGMGFTDQYLNILLLQQSTGNVPTVCHWLLDKSGAPPGIINIMNAHAAALARR